VIACGSLQGFAILSGQLGTYFDRYIDEGDMTIDAKLRSLRRGFLNPQMVRALSFWTTSICLLVAVVASLLAIWDFTGKDTLWRTVATCVVIGAGTMVFAWLNTAFGEADEQGSVPRDT
jgi:hypothetical protein